MGSAAESHLLILETSGRVGKVALASGPHLLGSRSLEESRRHARDLAPAIVELLTAQGWQPRDLHGIIVSRGPGSYTGLRVGIMSAKTLAYALGCRLLAIETFAALAHQVPAEVARLEVIGDAQQGKIYLQPFVRSHSAGCCEAQAPLNIRRFDDWLAQREVDTWITGPGLHVYQGRLPPGSRIVAAACWEPQPQTLLRLGLDRFCAGESDDLWSLEPLYLRPSSAEEQWQTRT